MTAALPTFPNGCHVCEVEIDEETGAIEILRYNAVDEVGRAINPLLLEGQVHGGIAQAVGQCLMEDINYDPEFGPADVRLVHGLRHAARGRSAVLRRWRRTRFRARPIRLGVKGAGEAGTVGALPAVMNAINDALAQAGVHYVQMPCTPAKVWRALNEAKARQT